MITSFARQLSMRSNAHKLTFAMVAASIVQALSRNAGVDLFSFRPISTVLGLEVWRPITALFVSSSPREVVFGGLIIYSIGGALESQVGRQRFLTLAIAIPFIAELLTLPIFFLFSSLPDLPYPGSRSVVTSVWIAFGLIAARSGQMLQFWGNPVSGRSFALLGLGFVLLSAVFGGFIFVLPELLAAGLTYGYLLRRRNFDIKRRIELLYYNWKLRRLKAKRGFHVVRGVRSDGDDDPSKGHIH
jgi:membrane associated rhomboid family serine protease